MIDGPTTFTIKNLVRMREALDYHNRVCGTPANAITLNPLDHALLGWNLLWGVAVIADDSVGVKRFRIDCDEYTAAGPREQELVHAG
ncbi:MAG TPA: hypothetical protein VGM91_24245 [Conexibacter sp.]|jgi:hypothetical protein